MRIKIWGTRGSIPTPISSQELRDKMITVVEGAKAVNLDDPIAVRDYVDRLPALVGGTAGGNTACVELNAAGQTIILDAGSGIRPLGLALMSGLCGQGKGRLHLLFSHTHWDHIQGLPFFIPAYVPGNHISIYGVHDVEIPLTEQMKPATFPVSMAEMRTKSTIDFTQLQEGEGFSIGDVQITTMRLTHPGDAYAYRFVHNDMVFVYSTDVECKQLDEAHLQPYFQFVAGADLLIFDTQFTLRESILKADWGHSSALVGAEIARRAGVKRLVLFHHDPLTTDADLVKILDQTIAYQTSHQAETAVEFIVGQEGLVIDLTPPQPFRFEPTPPAAAVSLHITEGFDQQHAAAVIEQVTEVITSEHLPRLVVDLSDVNQLNIPALRSLIELRYEWQNRPMALANLSAQAREVIELANCLDLFAIYPTAAAAHEALEARDNLHLPGQFVKDRYRIEAKLREAEIGTIFKAADTRLERTVALMVLSPTLSQLTTQRLIHQAQKKAQLQNPHIVTLFDSDEDRGLAYLVMEYTANIEILRTLIRRKAPLSPFKIGDEILQGLAYAHSKNIYHGGLKPENILIGETAKLSDFGLSPQETGKRLVDSSLVINTPHYLAPEQIEGKPIDARTDLYAVGAILYELVTGRRPFEGEGLAVLEQHLRAEPIPPRQLNPRLSRSFEHLILKLLAKSPAQRYTDAAEVRQVLLNLDQDPVPIQPGQHQSSTSDKTATDLIPPPAPPLDTPELALQERSALVDREQELDRILRLWRRAQDGHGQILLIGGEAGIGKTRLAEEVAAYAEHGLVLLGRCSEFEGNPPYQPFVEIGRDYLAHTSPETFRAQLGDSPAAANFAAVLAPLIPEIYELLPGLNKLAPLDEPEQEQLRLRSSFVQFISRAAADRPWILILDDLHWSDPSSLQMLHYISRHLNNLPILVIGTYRDVELDLKHPLRDLMSALARSPDYHHLTLQRLDIDSVAAMLRAIWQQQIPDEWAAAIYERSGGNPFYIEEVAKMLNDDGLITFADGQWHFDKVVELQLPQKVRDIVLRRVTRATPSTQEVLRQAAVIGQQWSFPDLLAVSGESEERLLACLDEAMARNLIREANTATSLCFSNVEIQQVIYEDLSQLRRRMLHQHVGETLERLYRPALQSMAGQLAHHFTQAGDKQRGFIYNLKAGQHAQGLYAYQTALHWYGQAAKLLPDNPNASPDHIDLYEGLGDMLQAQVRYADAGAAYQTMYDVAAMINDAVAKVRALYRLSSVQNMEGNYELALETARQTEQAARAAKTPSVLAGALFEQGWALLNLGETETALQVGEQARSFSATLDAKSEMAQSLNLLAAVQMALGNYKKAKDYQQQALVIYRTLGNRNRIAVMLNNLGETCRRQSDFSTASTLYQEALEIAQEIGDRANETIYLTNLGGALVGLGDYAAAEAHLKQVIETPETFLSANLSETYRFLAEAYLGQGRATDALTQAEFALALSIENKVPEATALAWRVLGQTATTLSDSISVQGQAVSAIDCFEKSYEIFVKLSMTIEQARNLQLWAQSEAQNGQVEKANKLQQAADEILAGSSGY